MKTPWAATCILILTSACAGKTSDHFYVLSALPPDTSEARPVPSLQATLKVSLPASADRTELLLNTSAQQVVVLEHERWAAPLAELTAQTLARDLERRRNDVLVSVHDAGRTKGTDVRITVDVTQLTLHRGEQARIETQWRILDVRTGKEVVGSGRFSAPLAEGDYGAVAQSLSECLGLLADRLAEQMR